MSEITTNKMLSAGYLAKTVMAKPEGLQAPQVTDIYSVSGCMSKNFADYVNFWKHNGWWLFDAPEIIQSLIAEHQIAAVPLSYFYYEVYEQEYDQESRQWRPVACEKDFTTDIQAPDFKRLEGYDVVSFYAQNAPECSPLSCNNRAREIPTNRHCLFDNFSGAKQAIDIGQFDNSEPGPLRIMAVYTLSDTRDRRERLRYRSHHRGTKEMDVLLGRFAERHLDDFGVTELADYEALLDEQDQDLYDWASGRSAPPKEKQSRVMQAYLAMFVAGA